MSNNDSASKRSPAPNLPATPAEAARNVRDEARFGKAFLRVHGFRLLLVFAGIGSKGIVASSAALAVLLQEGIGDTIRISLTPEPGAPRTQEVVVAQELLQTMGLRAFTPMVTACPGCGRTTSEFFQHLAKVVQEHVRAKMPEWRISHPGAEGLTLAVMGCVVNGPGESRHANIGISLPGTGESPAAPVFVDGEKTVTLRGDSIAEDFIAIIDDYVEQRFGIEALAGAEPARNTG